MFIRSFVVSLLLAGCGPEADSEAKPNGAPSTPSIVVSPSTAATDEDLLVVFTSESSDPDGDEVTYRYLWAVDGRVRTDLTGDAVSARETTKGESWSVTVTPTDGELDAEPGTAEAAIVNTPPEATVTLDATVPQVEDAVTAVAVGTDLDDDTVSFSYAWTVDGEASEYSDAILPADVAVRGETWTLTATPFDGEESGEPVEASVMFENSPPTATGITIAPAPATEADTLVATVEGAADVDADAITFTYAWYADGAPVQEGASADLTADLFAKHQTIEVEATPNDGFTGGAAVRSAGLAIDNSVPSIASVTLDPATGYEATTLTCIPAGYADLDGDPEAYLYEWTVDGASVSTAASIDGTLFNKGSVVSCSITPNDGEVDGVALSSASLVISNTAATLTLAALTNRTPSETDIVGVTLSGGADDDGDSITYVYNWYVNGALAATTDTLDGDDFDKGDTIEVEVLPWDGAEYGASVWSDTAVAINTAPQLTAVSLTPTTAYTDDVLTAATTTSDDDGDSVSVTYTWYVDGVAIGATGATLDGEVYFDKGEAVYVVATPDDGEDARSDLASSTVTVLNSLPSITSVTIDPAVAYDASTLTCLPAGYADLDGDTAVYTYAWAVDGVTVSNSASIDGTLFDKGGSVACTITPSDGEDTGTAMASAAMTVSNTAPTLASAALTNRTPSETDIVGVTLSGGADDDGDSVTYAYNWYVNSALVATTSTLDGDEFDKGDSIQVEVLPWDGTEYGAAVWSDTAVAVNTAPMVTAASLTPTSAYTDDVLTATVSTSDADGDSVSVGYTWYVNGVPISATDATLDGDLQFDKADEVYVVATPDDGEDSGTGLSSSSRTILNSSPTAPVVAVSPSDPEDADELVCDVVTPSTDADGDSLSYTYSWEVDGSDAGIASDTVPADSTAVGDSWTCVVVADDAEDVSSEATDSVSITGACAALDFDGSNDYVSLPSFSGLSSYTYELWVDADSRGASSAPDILVATTCGQLVWDSGGFEINNYPSCNGASPAYVNWSIPYTSWPTGWTHIAMVVSSSTSARVFVNGDLVATAALSSDSPGSTQYGGIGGGNTSFGTNYFLDGRIAGVRISNTARYSSSFTPESTFTADSATVALYAMDEGSGATLTDSSGSGLDGTVVGATWTEGECP